RRVGRFCVLMHVPKTARKEFGIGTLPARRWLALYDALAELARQRGCPELLQKIELRVIRAHQPGRSRFCCSQQTPSGVRRIVLEYFRASNGIAAESVHDRELLRYRTEKAVAVRTQEAERLYSVACRIGIDELRLLVEDSSLPIGVRTLEELAIDLNLITDGGDHMSFGPMS
ncbi:MAG TPA: hypothetical protein VMI56_00045, partial [Reyranella sp.]|nr:hypothetical protein [Reyranella sp.]